MQFALVLLAVGNSSKKSLVLIKTAVCNGVIYPYHRLEYGPSRTDGHVPYLRIALISLRKPNSLSISLDQGIGIFFHQPVCDRRSSLKDSIVFMLFSVSPSIPYNKNYFVHFINTSTIIIYVIYISILFKNYSLVISNISAPNVLKKGPFHS